MRTRAVAVVIRDGHVLVIRRRREGRSYTVLPGGGIEDGESAREACLRELREETGLDGVEAIALTVPSGAGSKPAHHFAVTVAGGVLRLGGPEAARASADNVYVPQWVELSMLDEIGLVPEAARDAVRSALRVVGG